MLTLHINLVQIRVFLSILLRISIVLFMMPIFSSRTIPNTIKALAALALTTIVFLTLHQQVAPLPIEAGALLRIGIGEVIFGTILALAVLLVFAAFQFAGDIIGFQMGFGLARVADPQSGNQGAVLSTWFQLFATLLFFALNGDHILLAALVESFRAVPVGGFTLTSSTFGKLVVMSGQLFVIGIKMAAPVMIVLFLAQVGLGLVAKFAPEVNVLIASFPITILLGLLFMGLSISLWGSAMQHYLAMFLQFAQFLAGR
jgi:flagellar biosynthetic protein FliR